MSELGVFMVFNILFVESIILGEGGRGIFFCIGYIDMFLYLLSGVFVFYWFENRYIFCLEFK